MAVTQIWVWSSLSSNHSDQNELVVETMQGNTLCKVQIQQNTNPNYIRLSGILPKHPIWLSGDELNLCYWVSCVCGQSVKWYGETLVLHKSYYHYGLVTPHHSESFWCPSHSQSQLWNATIPLLPSLHNSRWASPEPQALLSELVSLLRLPVPLPPFLNSFGALWKPSECIQRGLWDGKKKKSKGKISSLFCETVNRKVERAFLKKA